MSNVWKIYGYVAIYLVSDEGKSLCQAQMEIRLLSFYLCIVEQLQLFDSSGNLRERKEAERNIELALELIELE